MKYSKFLCRQFLTRCCAVLLGMGLSLLATTSGATTTGTACIGGNLIDSRYADQTQTGGMGGGHYTPNVDASYGTLTADSCFASGGNCFVENITMQIETEPAFGQRTLERECYSGSTGVVTPAQSAAQLAASNWRDPFANNAQAGIWTSNLATFSSCAQTTQDRSSTACPGGQTGTITERQTLNQGGVCGSNSGWVQISNTCAASYTYYWSAGGFNGWSACDNGQQHRERGVWCYRSDGTMMDPDQSQCYATAGPKPQWQEFQSCNAGYATDTQPFVCKRADGVVVPESYCAGQGRPADNTRQGQVCMSSCTASTEDRTSTPCPAGQTGTITERRTLNQGGVCGSNSGWGEIGRTCQVVNVTPTCLPMVIAVGVPGRAGGSGRVTAATATAVVNGQHSSFAGTPQDADGDNCIASGDVNGQDFWFSGTFQNGNCAGSGSITVGGINYTITVEGEAIASGSNSYMTYGRATISTTGCTPP